ncbi:MAG TPA: serine/threonine-protein kinase, partial [Kofleriaceae bacterium]|nr:serine/threonine-protein kinase [Kofleriaceae bacterium]
MTDSLDPTNPSPEEATSRPPPERIGAYRLQDKLGEGGMGAVYVAIHELLGRRAAIKLLHDRYSKRDEIVERFFNEARAATAIADPGIVQVFDFGYEDGNVFIVMELLEGETLERRVRRLGRLQPAHALRLARQLALSLYAAHERGVIHRDLKPENVIIVTDHEAATGERTKILDFGIAKLTDASQTRVHTQTGLMMGTPHYMSPEQCRGVGNIDARADIYSLGCVMFRLLTGRTVFLGEGAGDLVVAHMTLEPPLPSSFVTLPAAVDRLVMRCLAKSPAERLQTMRDVAIEIDAALAAVRTDDISNVTLTPIPVGPDAPRALADTTPSGPAPIARPKRRVVVPALVVVVAAVAGYGGWMWTHPSEPPAPPIASPAIP